MRNRKRSSAAAQNNVMRWLEDSCPLEIVGKVLAFTGPKTAAVLQQTNRFWWQLMLEESTWRTMCEELYKWKEGDPIPKSWKALYAASPCVPIDYSTVAAALAAGTTYGSLTNNSRLEQRHNLRILLRPGKHHVRESLRVTASERTTVTFETMELPSNTFMLTEPPSEGNNAADAAALEQAPSSPETPAKRALRRASALRQRFSCRSTRTIDDIVLEDLMIDDFGEDESNSHSRDGQPQSQTRPVRASMVLRTRRQNEPMILHQQGSLKLTNIAMVHSSPGVDIWQGNAAVQIQPLRSNEDPLAPLTRPTAVLDRCDITSRSGRGVVNIDGGYASIKNCYVHDCAATGIYVGGPGSDANIVKTDVVRNGSGTRSRRGIARGHSGIYLEQGTARIHDCNISRNSLTGISAISASNAVLSLEASDLFANGGVQLEMPPNGSVARRRSWARDNNMAVEGFGRSRSSLAEDSDESPDE